MQNIKRGVSKIGRAARRNEWKVARSGVVWEINWGAEGLSRVVSVSKQVTIIIKPKICRVYRRTLRKIESINWKSRREGEEATKVDSFPEEEIERRNQGIGWSSEIN